MVFTVADTVDGGFGAPVTLGANAMVVEGTLAPTALLAVARNMYDVPPTKPVMVAERMVGAVVVTAVHVAPASVDTDTV